MRTGIWADLDALDEILESTDRRPYGHLQRRHWTEIVDGGWFDPLSLPTLYGYQGA